MRPYWYTLSYKHQETNFYLENILQPRGILPPINFLFHYSSFHKCCSLYRTSTKVVFMTPVNSRALYSVTYKCPPHVIIQYRGWNVFYFISPSRLPPSEHSNTIHIHTHISVYKSDNVMKPFVPFNFLTWKVMWPIKKIDIKFMGSTDIQKWFSGQMPVWRLQHV